MRLGAIFLSLWAGINLLLAIGILVSMTVLGKHPPSLAIFLSEAEIALLPARALALVDTLGMLLNACVASFCLTLLVLIWKAVVVRIRWAYRTVLTSTLFLQAFGFACDAYLGHRNLLANTISTVILIAGLILTRS
jgi:hypothetical protein